jgi:RNA polymerase sigma factor (sigma-70 family)
MGLTSELSTHIKSLRRYSLMLTRDPAHAEDLLQETLLKAINRAETWQPGSDMRPWLFRIMHNTFISDLRRAKTRADAAPDLPVPVSPETQHSHIELQQVLRALDQLPEAQRGPIVLIALREMSYADAARSLEIPLGTFMSRLGRGREALRKLVQSVGQAGLSVVATKENGK